MIKIYNKFLWLLKTMGVDLKKMFYFFRGMPKLFMEYQVLKRQNSVNREFSFGKMSPIVKDLYQEAGTMSGHYFHQDVLVARRIYDNKPQRHIDIGSRIDGFVAHVAIFREIEIFDIREVRGYTKNISFKQADLMHLDDELVGSCDSVSSLHAIEHFGLGRYGDSLDIDGHKKAIYNISKLLCIGGIFYFSVPIGPQRIEFNAQRVFELKYLIELLGNYFEFKNFNYVDDDGDLHEDICLTDVEIDNNFGCYYGCGIFELVKKNNG